MNPHHFIIQQVLELNNLLESPCDVHREKHVELYCRDCNENICVSCFCDNHRTHNTVEIRQAADNFKQRFDDDYEQILSVISPVREQSEQTKTDATECRSKVEEVKKRVVATGDVVKRSVDDQINDLLMKLESVTSESDKEAENVQEAVVSMENFCTYSRELLDKSRPSDITREACKLHDRATELLDITAVKYRPPHLTFVPADVMQVKYLGLIGELTIEDQHAGMS